MAPDCTDVTGLYRWHRIIQMVPSCTDVTGLYRWQRIVQMAPDCTDSTGLCCVYCRVTACFLLNYMYP